jgi:outer membrane protein assembly factor BamB
VKTRYGWGTAASPILHEGRVYIVNDNDDASYLLALDKKTGAEIWKVDRQEKSNWSTPYIWTHDGKSEIVTTGTGRVRSYDLDGKVLWEFGGMSSIAIPTPFAKHGLLFISSGYVGDAVRPVWAVKPGAKGDITLPKGETSSAFIAWYNGTAGPYNPSPLVYGDYYYTLMDRGFLTCHEAKTGKEIYGKQRLDQASQAFTASPWAYNGKIFMLSEDGDTFVVEAGTEYKLLWKNSLNEMTMATPAVAKNSLIIRTAGRLYKIGK